MFIYPVADGMQFFSFHRVWWKVYLKFFPSRKTRRQNSVWVLFEWRYMKKQSVLLERFFFSSFWKSATIIFSPKKKSFVVIFRDTCVNGFYNSAKLFNLLSKLNKSLYKKKWLCPDLLVRLSAWLKHQGFIWWFSVRFPRTETWRKAVLSAVLSANPSGIWTAGSGKDHSLLQTGLPLCFF